MSEERFFIDHGVIHDRVTGKHVRSYDVPIENSGEDGIVECCALMNKLSGAEDANRYHQALGAKWMVEAIVRHMRTTYQLDAEDTALAKELERKWEDKGFWRPGGYK